jgi:Spx/MgsR family transcriptional regulator
MTILTLYGLKNCSTCVKALGWLTQHGHDASFVDYRANPVAPERLSQWAEQLGGWEKLVNRASMTWRNLAEERKSPGRAQEWLDLIAEFPTLVRRPVMIANDDRVMVGFSEKKYMEFLA